MTDTNKNQEIHSPKMSVGESFKTPDNTRPVTPPNPPHPLQMLSHAISKTPLGFFMAKPFEVEKEDGSSTLPNPPFSRHTSCQALVHGLLTTPLKQLTRAEKQKQIEIEEEEVDNDYIHVFDVRKAKPKEKVTATPEESKKLQDFFGEEEKREDEELEEDLKMYRFQVASVTSVSIPPNRDSLFSAHRRNSKKTDYY